MSSDHEHRRVAIVTGAAQGIGFAVASRLLTDTCCVVLTDVDARAGEAAADRLDSEHAFFHPCDVSDEYKVAELFHILREQLGRIDVVVNNAGIIRDSVIWKMSAEDFDAVIRVNLRGTWLMCRQAATIMKEQASGAIVNIASRAWLGNPGQTNYSASKAGVIGLTRSLALELGRSGIRVNAVAPGLIDTPLVRKLEPDVRERLVQAQPTRTMGTPEDVAEAVAFLASPASRFITGQVIYVDGGKSIGAGI